MTKLIQNKKGMTLVEMLVGMVIAGAFMILIIQAYTVTMKMSQTGIQRIEQLEEGQLILEQITRDLHSLVLVNDTDETVLFQLEESKYLQFVHYKSSSDSTNAELENVRYSLASSNRILRQTSTPVERAGGWQTSLSKGAREGSSRLLGIGLENTSYVLKIESFDVSSTTGSWISDWMSRKTLPPLVKVTLKLQNTKILNNHIELTRTIRIGEL